MLVSRSVYISHCKVFLHFSFVNLEEEVLLSDNFRVGISGKDFRVYLLLEFNKLEFLFNDSVNLGFYFLDSLSIVGLDDLRLEGLTNFVLVLKFGKIGSFLRSFGGLESILLSRVFPKRNGFDVTCINFLGVNRLSYFSRYLSGECTLSNYCYTTAC